LKTLIVFYPYNNLAIDQLSVLEVLKKKFKVILLTIEIKGDLHKAATNLKIINYSLFEKKSFIYNIIQKKIFLLSKILFYFNIFYKFQKIIIKEKANFVFAHLEIAGLISSICEKIINFKSFYFRHNTDAHLVDGNLKSRVINTSVNFLAKKIICVSSAVKEYLINKEKIDPKKIYQINYGYNFYLYYKFKSYKKKKINTYLNSKTIKLITIGRLVNLKRHILVFKLMHKLKNYKKKYTLFCLGSGKMDVKLKNYKKINKLKNIKIFGYKKNILDYLFQSDILIHFSKSESFGHVILEAALLKKPVIVCRNVGIFNNLINNGVNGFLVSKNDPITQTLKILNTITKNKIRKLGLNLYNSMIKKYHISNYENKYLRLLK
jgi:glycosyltransferase involved in cell wall biosynthesis